MHVFVTGASGWVGSATVPELIANGHRVRGLARSEAAAEAIEAVGATAVPGDIDRLDVLAREAASADAVIHLAYKHDFSNLAESNRAERAVVQTLLDALEGSGKPLLFAAGVAGLTPGRAATERDPNPGFGADAPRGGAENLALSYADRGVVPVSLRFAPTVHGMGDHGFMREIAKAARRRGVSGYVEDGAHGWAAVHHRDLARLIALVLAQPERAEGIVHGVAESSVSTAAIAKAIGARFDLGVVSVPADRAVDHFGFIGAFFALDLSASATLTRERFDWTPRERGVLDDIAAGGYDVG